MGLGLKSPRLALDTGFTDRLVGEMARTQIKICMQKFKQLGETSHGNLLLVMFGIFRNQLYGNKLVKEHLGIFRH